MFPRKLSIVLLGNLAFTAILCVSPQASADISINGYTPATNDRFTNSPQFIAGAFDLSGIGQNAIGQWATLISPNVVISAHHFIPSGPIVFHSGNSPLSPSFAYNIIDSIRVGGNSDIWIGQLNSAVDPSITPFKIATEILTGVSPNPLINIRSAGIYQNAIGFMVGLSPALQNPTQDQAFGQNRIRGYAQEVAFNGLANALILDNDPQSNPNFVPYEAILRGGDSGAPFFVADSPSSLKLLGINSFLLENSDKIPVASGISYVGNSAQEIQAFVNTRAVPEPATVYLIGIMIIAVTLRKYTGFWAQAI